MISASHALGYYRGVLGVPHWSLKPRHARGFLSFHAHRRAPNGKCGVSRLVMTGSPGRVMASPGPSENPHGGAGRLDDPLTRTVDAATEQKSVRDTSRICGGFLRADGAMTARNLTTGPCQAHPRRLRARERCQS